MLPLWTDPCVCVQSRVTPLAARSSFLPRGSRRGRSYLSDPSAARGWGSVKTCSVNGPGGPTSVWLGVVSGTSVASVASSADCAGWIFPLTGGAVGAEEQPAVRKPVGLLPFKAA